MSNAKPALAKSCLVSLKNISKRFVDVGTAVNVLDGLDFNVYRNEFIAICGASGVGKSTLLHIVGMLDTPNSGKVYFNDEDVTGFSDRKLSAIRNGEIGFVFQFHHLLPDFTAWENVLMPLKIAGHHTEREIAYGKELIELMGLENRKNHLPAELSGGERQRMALARALIFRPQLLLADEPSGNLDEKNKESLHHLLTDVHERLGVTIILVTHDNSLSDLAQKQYLMRDGKIFLERDG